MESGAARGLCCPPRAEVGSVKYNRKISLVISDRILRSPELEMTVKAGVGALRTILYRAYQELGVCQSSWKYGETTGVDILLQQGAAHVCGLRDSTFGRDWVGYRSSGHPRVHVETWEGH